MVRPKVCPLRSATGNDDGYDVVITSGLQNGSHLGSTILDFRISPKLQESAEIEPKVIKTKKGKKLI